jgi:FKBP-type peptidyl-prolyl cis-trans isomerase FkpA/FKBP-type peptidyl-prolyl cis-trans isomerase FklB
MGDFMHINNRNSNSLASFRALLTVAGLSLAVMMFGCEKKVKIETDDQKASYGIGTQIGNNMKQQNISIDPDALVTGMKDALAGKDLKLKPEEIQQALMKMQETAMKKQSEKAEKNKTEGAAFLEKNKAKAGVKTTASGLQYEVLKEGTGKTPTKADKVSAHYLGTLTDGTKFDSSYDRNQPAEFDVTGVIPGWTEALMLMKEGSKYKLYVPADLAYGPSGRPGIPPNSVLIFEVELLKVMPGVQPKAVGGAIPDGKKHK